MAKSKILQEDNEGALVELGDGRQYRIKKKKTPGPKPLGKKQINVTLYSDSLTKITEAAKASCMSRSEWIEQTLLRVLEKLPISAEEFDVRSDEGEDPADMGVYLPKAKPKPYFRRILAPDMHDPDSARRQTH